MSTFFDRKREELEMEVAKAALELCAFVGSAGFAAPVPHTTPQLFFAFGEKEQIMRFMANAGEIAGESVGGDE